MPKLDSPVKDEGAAGMTLDQLDALVNEEIQRHEAVGVEQPVVMAETLDPVAMQGVAVNHEVEDAKIQSV